MEASAFWVNLNCAMSLADSYFAIANLTPTLGQTTYGQVVVQETPSIDEISTATLITMTVQLAGLAPGSVHGIHIHAFGDISDPTGVNQFGHFNPTNKSHGCPANIQRTNGSTTQLVYSDFIHAGDFGGNLVADQFGNAMAVFERNVTDITLKMDSIFSLIGRGFVVHDKVDDCQSQPAGNSGVRVAQGVFGWKNGTTIPALPTPNTVLESSSPKSAISVLMPANNATVSGTVKFSQTSPTDPVQIFLNLTGVAPSTTHGLHIHSFGDVSDYEKANAVGGHFNPLNVTSHGCPAPGSPSNTSYHAGDLGNVQADANGNIQVMLASSDISLYRGKSSYILGRSVSLHNSTDDCVSNPAGNSGVRIAQGVIGLRNATLDSAIQNQNATVFPSTGNIDIKVSGKVVNSPASMLSALIISVLSSAVFLIF